MMNSPEVDESDISMPSAIFDNVTIMKHVADIQMLNLNL